MEFCQQYRCLKGSVPSRKRYLLRGQTLFLFCFLFLRVIILVPFAVITANKLVGELSFRMPCLRGILIAASFIKFFRHDDPSLSSHFSVASGDLFIREN